MSKYKRRDRTVSTRNFMFPERGRKPNRLKDYNYSEDGYYFVTICTKGRKEYFGQVINGQMILNSRGKIANGHWQEIVKHYKNVLLDEYVIMPNHIHGIIIIENTVGTEKNSNINVGTEQCSVPTKYGQLSKVIKSFKNAVTKDFKNNFKFCKSP